MREKVGRRGKGVVRARMAGYFDTESSKEEGESERGDLMM
jgi:hypothetical protein